MAMMSHCMAVSGGDYIECVSYEHLQTCLCDSANLEHYKLYKNASIVGIGPSKPKLWLIKLEQITTKPFAWMLIYVRMWKP